MIAPTSPAMTHGAKGTSESDNCCALPLRSAMARRRHSDGPSLVVLPDIVAQMFLKIFKRLRFRDEWSACKSLAFKGVRSDC